MIKLNSTPQKIQSKKVNSVDHTAIFDTHSSISFSNLELKRLIQHVKETKKEVSIWMDIEGIGSSVTVEIFELEKLEKEHTGDFLLNHVSICSSRVILFAVK